MSKYIHFNKNLVIMSGFLDIWLMRDSFFFLEKARDDIDYLCVLIWLYNIKIIKT